ncbi:MAG TPA: nuclear transport factor 2 family protein [Gammaproteobacteria bacterium]|nr:nuclear transport factor 2 family protein [Gammaproteobacteria bacterium]
MGMHMFRAACAAAMLALAAGCSNVDNKGDAVDPQVVQQLTARVQRLEDTLAIQKLQAKYVNYLFLQKYDRIFEELYAQKNPDVSIEFSDSGVYRGPESVRALYHAFDVTKKIPGFFLMHMAVDPYIEIAGDGQSARSQWLSPGITGSNTSAGWVFGPYYVDYVKEDGRWKILHSNLAPIVRTAFETSWAKATDNGTVRGVLKVEPDGPSTLYRPYAERKKEPDMFKAFPELPKPY